MRRIKVKLSPSLEQDDITQRLEEALSEEKGTTQETTEITETNNDQQETMDETTEITEVADTETSISDSDPTDNEVVDTITETVVDTVNGEQQETPAASFATKIKESFDLAVEKGFTGSFDDFLVTLTDNISQKESTPANNALGTTDGSGDLVEPESEVSEIEEEASNDETVDEVSDDVTEEESEDTEVGEGNEEEEEGSSEATDDESIDTPEESEVSETNETEEESESEESTEPESSEETVEAEEGEEAGSDTNLNGEEVPVELDTPKADEVEDPEGTDDESLKEYADEIVEDEEDEASEEDEMVEEALDTSDRLGRIAEIVKEAVEEAKEGDEEDANESLAKIAELATECLKERVGIVNNIKLNPSLESFKDKEGVMYRYEVSLEDIKETTKKIIDAVVKFIEKIAEWIKEKSRAIQLSIGFTEKKIAALEKKVAKVSGAPKEKEIISDSIARVISIGGQLSADQATEINKVAKLGTNVYGTMTDWVKKEVRSVLERQKDTKTIRWDFVLPDVSSFGLFESANPAKEGILDSEEVKYLKAAKSPELPGMKTLVFVGPKKNEQKPEDVYKLSKNNYVKALINNKIYFKMMDYDKSADNEVFEGKVLSVMNPTQIKESIKSLKELLKVVQEYKKVQSEIKPIRNAISIQAKLITFAVNNSTKDDGGMYKNDPNKEKILGSQSVSGIFRTIARLINEPTTSFTDYALRLINAEIAYIGKSIAQYELIGEKDLSNSKELVSA